MTMKWTLPPCLERDCPICGAKMGRSCIELTSGPLARRTRKANSRDQQKMLENGELHIREKAHEARLTAEQREAVYGR